MMYLKLPLICLWLVFSCVLGLIGCLVRWGDLNLDHYFGHLFAWGTLRISGIRVVAEGAEHLSASQPCIYAANHQSGMDMATFGSLYPKRTVVVGKKELLYIPFFGLFFKAAGNIVINRQKRVSAISGLSAAAEQIRNRRLSVWIFPEGTRNRTAEPMMPFKKGAFYMAIQAQVPIVPIVSTSLDGLVNWPRKIMRSGIVRVRVLPPIPTAGMTSADADRLGKETRDRMLAALRDLTEDRGDSPGILAHPPGR
jgi:1-acyl-sn-glycerol-3-phosphate acyltransferase